MYHSRHAKLLEATPYRLDTSQSTLFYIKIKINSNKSLIFFSFNSTQKKIHLQIVPMAEKDDKESSSNPFWEIMRIR